MVREDGAAGRAGAGCGARRPHSDPAGTLAGRVHQLARRHSRLEHLAPVVVGPSRAGVLLRWMRAATNSVAHADHDLRGVWWNAAAGRRRPRHLVLELALADVDAGLAERGVGRSEGVLSWRCAGDSAGDSVLLGRAYDHVGAAFHGRRAVSHRVSARYGARHESCEDVEVTRQRHRSAGCGEAVRCRCIAMDDDRGHGAGRGCAARSHRS